MLADALSKGHSMTPNDTTSSGQAGTQSTWRLTFSTVERDENGNTHVAEQARRDGLRAGSPLEAVAAYLRELGVHSDESKWDVMVMAESSGWHNVQLVNTDSRWDAAWLQVDVRPTVGSHVV